MDEHIVSWVYIHWEWLVNLNFQDQDPKYKTLIYKTVKYTRKLLQHPKRLWRLQLSKWESWFLFFMNGGSTDHSPNFSVHFWMANKPSRLRKLNHLHCYKLFVFHYIYRTCFFPSAMLLPLKFSFDTNRNLF